MKTNPETSPQLELDDETAYEVAWGMITNRIAEASAEHGTYETGTAEAGYQLDRIRALVAVRDTLSPDNRDTLDVVTALVPALAQPAESSGA